MNILTLSAGYTNTRGTSLEVVINGGTIPSASFDLTEAIVVDGQYELEYEILEISEGQVRFAVGGGIPAWSDFESSPGTYTQTLTALGTSEFLLMRAATGTMARLRMIKLDAL